MAKTTEEKFYELIDKLPEEEISPMFSKVKERFATRQKEYQAKLELAANNAQIDLNRINGNNA